MEHKKKLQLKSKMFCYEKKVSLQSKYVLNTLDFRKKPKYKDIFLELSNLKYKIKLYSNYYKYSFLEEKFLSFHLNRLYDHAFFLFPSVNSKVFFDYKTVSKQKNQNKKEFLKTKYSKLIKKNFFYFI